MGGNTDEATHAQRSHTYMRGKAHATCLNAFQVVTLHEETKHSWRRLLTIYWPVLRSRKQSHVHTDRRALGWRHVLGVATSDDNILKFRSWLVVLVKFARSANRTCGPSQSWPEVG